ncbi:hypothetical protein BH10ACI1_BH10ACI1_26380 [soil metagenome]
MKEKFLLIALFLLLFVSAVSCQTNVATINEKSVSAEKSKPCEFLTPSDAEKILGQTVRLIENTSKIEGDVSKSDCVYRGISKDKVSGKDVNLYFSLERQEQNPTVEQARQIFASTYKKINEPALSVEVLSGIGDEAFSISNPSNFHFIMVRKGEIIFRIKLNKATENTSLEELKAFAKKFAEQL